MMLLQRTKISLQPLKTRRVKNIGVIEAEKKEPLATEPLIEIRKIEKSVTTAEVEKVLVGEITSHFHPISPASVADVESEDNRIYYSKTLNQLVYKDETGDVYVLQQSIGDGEMGLKNLGEQEALNLMLGASGMDYIPSNKTGRWGIVHCLEDTVFASLDSSIASNLASLLGATVAANTKLYGKFTTINLSAGSVLAYRY